ncbi:MAG TPA: pyridoxal phosphate-dependent aminotransferase [Thermococcus sp.]|uniref:pyridoxal phosphate-dependent aminotransferase n=1 Tax=Thermococcus sp. TaxID=35749 RepID=UPI000BD7FA40|nr:pyridoxal phosphate-dependent aminotransferase [Thermococcus sp.]OYT32922.1 MAG: aromatic amino acid aminotransferase [Archaeoglobales archaeon ex4484_92]RLF81830.1 MAG: pyridoxal phosphate-dependent aminotransferase [Thermococci archaeon]MCD6139993.1 pyridoxal phosphate-dependent aminotransferase [Thermococcus sp.]MCD6143056.1 pyridoxal phosphate-dependent aminotransferase [Thermococcus sp.]RLF85288.1 MAG: pyridoxal phosphate-dependent aminotransferase [Thermococci archaeon]
MRYKKHKYFVAGRINLIQRSKIRELFERASKMKNVISLGIGEPDFDTPQNIKEAAKRALDEGWTHYTPNAGIAELRNAISEYYASHYGMRIPPQNVLVTAGAYEATYLAFESLLEEGDEVIIPDPAFVCYVEDAKVSGAKYVRLPLKEENEFQPDPDELLELITKRTRMIVLNYPNNPTGATLDDEVAKAVADIAQDYNIYILSDEPYEHFLYDGAKHVPMMKYASDNTILANSFSKTFAMTGWRLGFTIAPEDVIKDMIKLHAYIIGNVASFVQVAGSAALREEASWKAVEEMRKEYEKRRKLVLEHLKEMPYIKAFEPKGAFYVFANITGTGMKSEEFAEWLLDKVGVVVIPGTAFGPNGEGYIRISYATSQENLLEAMARMKKALEEL